MLSYNTNETLIDTAADVTMVQRSSTYVMSVEKGIMASLPGAHPITRVLSMR